MMNNNKNKKKWKQSFVSFKGKKTKYGIYVKNTKQVRPKIREKLQKHYLNMSLPKNLIWDPLGYGGSGSLRARSGMIDRAGELRTKFDTIRELNDDGLIIPLPCLHREECPDIKADPQWKKTMKGVCDTLFIEVPSKLKGYAGYMIIKERLPSIFNNLLKTMGCFQYRIVAEGVYYNPTHPDLGERNLRVSTSRSICQGSDNINEVMNDITQKLIVDSENKETEGSGWVLLYVWRIQIDLCQYQPIGGSSYIPLPQWFKSKCAVVSPQNKKDNECFKWCCCIHQFHVNENKFTNDPQRVAPYKKLLKQGHKLDINLEGLTYPVTVYG